ncbi:MAG TPA: tRNA (adenosine(37)-N6)-threonylcarbamoyltransferase complex dimerization subunit type 1 TsaB [Gemmatimonadaceae bacterium]|nr:tRNA (adenosine(37)-N6)-threonylcarbamoyltransferase complex dimerization subunit type 1 TsaB [Gemmatimonadaceae bacterium]
MNVLAIDASTYTGTVAVLRDTTLAAECETAMRGRDVERLMPAVAEALGAAGVVPDALDFIVCGAGPGSFTSLRIAASIAKGLAFSRQIPLRAVSSLVLMVAGLESAPAAGRYVAVLDALRGESYVQAIESSAADGGIRALEPPRILPNGDVDAFAESQGAVTVGVGQRVVAAPHARGVQRLLPSGGAELAVVDAASWEPDYGRLAEAQVRWEAAHGRPLPPG